MEGDNDDDTDTMENKCKNADFVENKKLFHNQSLKKNLNWNLGIKETRIEFLDVTKAVYH